MSNVAVFLNFGAKINENFTVHKHFGENYGVISFTSWAIFQRPKEKQFVLLMYIGLVSVGLLSFFIRRAEG